MAKTILALAGGMDRLFSAYGRVVNDPQVLLQEPVDVVIFPGGPDLPPSMYNEKPHPKTNLSHTHYQRFEDVFKQAANHDNCRMVGICGGAQFLCVKAGGRLVQHVENHRGVSGHAVHGVYGDADVTSAHHQMMRPYGTEHTLLAWANGLSDTHQDGNEEEVLIIDNKEPEAVLFHRTKKVPTSLGVQWHPEWQYVGNSGYNLFQTLLQNYIFD